MKGDMLLIGSAGAAVIAVPLAVMLWMGSPGLYASDASVPAAAYSSSSSEASSGPASSGESSSAGTSSQSSSEASAGSSGSDPGGSLTAAAEPASIGTFRLLDSETGQVLELSAFDYICGVLAAEVPPTYHMEALKAQATAAYTLSVYEAEKQRAEPSVSLKGADFAADPASHQGYISEEQARELYGDSFDEYWQYIQTAAAYGVSHLIVCDGQPVMAAYHAISAGSTENSANVW